MLIHNWANSSFQAVLVFKMFNPTSGKPETSNIMMQKGCILSGNKVEVVDENREQ